MPVAPIPNALAPKELFALVEDDPDIKKRVKVLFQMALESAIETMLHGDPASKASMTRLLLPTVTKAMMAGPNTEAADLRSQMKVVMAAAFGGNVVMPDAPGTPDLEG